jgi:hypothetical protein
MKLDLVTNASIDDDTRRLSLTKTVVKREAKVIIFLWQKQFGKICRLN